MTIWRLHWLIAGDVWWKIRQINSLESHAVWADQSVSSGTPTRCLRLWVKTLPIRPAPTCRHLSTNWRCVVVDAKPVIAFERWILIVRWIIGQTITEDVFVVRSGAKVVGVLNCQAKHVAARIHRERNYKTLATSDENTGSRWEREREREAKKEKQVGKKSKGLTHQKKKKSDTRTDRQTVRINYKYEYYESK